MAKRQRYWVCRRDARIYHRSKIDRYPPDCPDCGKEMLAARTYPADLWQRREVKRARAKVEAKRLTARYSKNRTLHDTRLRLSTPTRQAWRQVMTAKQRRTFKSRADTFLNTLLADIWTCPHGQWLRTAKFCQRCNPSAGAGGSSTAPKVEIKETFHSLGLFRRGVGGYGIDISWQKMDGKKEHDRHATLIHETVHWIDSMCHGIPEGYGVHTAAFYARVRDLARMLRFGREVT